MLVLDASVALAASAAEDGFRRFGRQQLVAPALLWSEARSALHESVCRRVLPRDQAERTLERLERSRSRSRGHPALARQAWRIADEFGWAKTYDAEYVALAGLLRCRLVTIDEALR